MKYDILTRPRDIEDAHKTMYDNLQGTYTRKGTIYVDNRGGAVKIRCRYSKTADMWWHRSKTPPGHDYRYWNPFGLGEPAWNKRNSMLLQINYKRRYDHRAQGAFVWNRAGNVYVAHTGRVGEHRRAKVLIPKNHRIKHIHASDDTKLGRELYLISDIASSKLAKNIREFLVFVKEAKEEPATGTSNWDGKAHIPAKKSEVVTRLIRDTSAVRQLKKAYRDKCQVCGSIIHLADKSRYSEVHHIRPLGRGGNDNLANMLVLCPNHHVMFDYGAIWISTDGRTVVGTAGPIERLTMHKKHKIAMKNILFHMNQANPKTG